MGSTPTTITAKTFLTNPSTHQSINPSTHQPAMLRIVLLSALVAVALSAMCNKDSHCGSEECCNILMVSKRADLGDKMMMGTCQKVKGEGESCMRYSTCGCGAGLSCTRVPSSNGEMWEFSPSTCQKSKTPVMVTPADELLMS